MTFKKITQVVALSTCSYVLTTVRFSLLQCSQNNCCQLSPIFTQIFNRSLEMGSPLKLQKLHHHPSSQETTTELHDYRPVALISVFMKSFERLVLDHLKNITGHQLEPVQFAHRVNRSVNNPVNMGLHLILQHHDQPMLGSCLWTSAQRSTLKYLKSSPLT